MRLGLLGVPFNSDGTAGGVALAPAALRARGLVQALRTIADVDDRGDVPIVPGGTARDRTSAIIAPLSAAAMSQAVAVAVRSLIDEGRFPLVIGGDCPILFGCLAAAQAADRSPSLLYIDGHEDAYPPAVSTTGELADMDLGLLLARNGQRLPTLLRAAIPTIAARDVAIVGARDAAETAAYGVGSLRDEVGYFADDVTLAADPQGIITNARTRLPATNPPWLHVDLDVLSTAALAAVDYPQLGGIDWSTLVLACVAALRHSPQLLGWDLTIYNPELDPTGAGADQIISFLTGVLGTVASSQSDTTGSARGDFLRRVGRHDAASHGYARAATPASSEAERTLLLGQLETAQSARLSRRTPEGMAACHGSVPASRRWPWPGRSA